MSVGFKICSFELRRPAGPIDPDLLVYMTCTLIILNLYINNNNNNNNNNNAATRTFRVGRLKNGRTAARGGTPGTAEEGSTVDHLL